MRFLQLKINTKYTEDIKEFYENSVLPQLQKMLGCIFAGLIKGGSEENEFVSLTFWETQEQAENYERSGVFQNLLNQAKPYLFESNEWKVQLSDKMELEYAPVTEEPVIKKYSVELQKENPAFAGDKLKIQSSQMYVRVVSMKIQIDKLEEFKELYSKIVIPALKETEGCRHVFLTESVNEKDEYISVTIWDSKEYADRYESSGKFQELVNQTKHTFSQFYLWKMALEKEYSAKITTTDDMKVESYNLITGKSFL